MDPMKETTHNFGIVIHGGAGKIFKKNMTPELEDAYQSKLNEAVGAGYAILSKGGSSIDAVITSVRILEDSPLFNAGKGAVFTHDETNELEASIMDGQTLNAGSVAALTHIKNPIMLAQAVMNNCPHVMLVGKGAESFAKQQGFKFVKPSYFYDKKRYQSLKLIKEKEITELDHDSENNDTAFGTVGCVALDQNGNLAAGTSTGGLTNKRSSRIGDSALIGAGTYANNANCAISCTGIGEYFIRSVAAYDLFALMEYKGHSVNQAAQDVIHNKIATLGGTGGLIAIDKSGNISMEFNTPGMYRAYISSNGTSDTQIYKF